MKVDRIDHMKTAIIHELLTPRSSNVRRPSLSSSAHHRQQQTGVSIDNLCTSTTKVYRLGQPLRNVGDDATMILVPLQLRRRSKSNDDVPRRRHNKVATYCGNNEDSGLVNNLLTTTTLLASPLATNSEEVLVSVSRRRHSTSADNGNNNSKSRTMTCHRLSRGSKNPVRNKSADHDLGDVVVSFKEMKLEGSKLSQSMHDLGKDLWIKTRVDDVGNEKIQSKLRSSRSRSSHHGLGNAVQNFGLQEKHKNIVEADLKSCRRQSTKNAGRVDRELLAKSNKSISRRKSLPLDPSVAGLSVCKNLRRPSDHGEEISSHLKPIHQPMVISQNDKKSFLYKKHVRSSQCIILDPVPNPITWLEKKVEAKRKHALRKIEQFLVGEGVGADESIDKNDHDGHVTDGLVAKASQAPASSSSLISKIELYIASRQTHISNISKRSSKASEMGKMAHPNTASFATHVFQSTMPTTPDQCYFTTSSLDNKGDAIKNYAEESICTSRSKCRILSVDSLDLLDDSKQGWTRPRKRHSSGSSKFKGIETTMLGTNHQECHQSSGSELDDFIFEKRLQKALACRQVEPKNERKGTIRRRSHGRREGDPQKVVEQSYYKGVDIDKKTPRSVAPLEWEH